MSRPKRQWIEPPSEPICAFTSHRTPTTWRVTSTRSSMYCKSEPISLTSSKTEICQLLGTSASVQPLHLQQVRFQGTCNFLRFKRVKLLEPEQSHEKTMLLNKRDAETCIVILAHLQRYSQLLQKTADSQYQDEHVTNMFPSYNQISTAHHLQVWQPFTEWCEPFGFHPANISASCLLDFVF